MLGLPRLAAAATLSVAVMALTAGPALAANISSTFGPSSWAGNPPASINGWVGGGNWGVESGGNGWLNGTSDGSRIRVDASSPNGWSTLSHDLTGQTSASLSTVNWQWRNFKTTGSNGLQAAFADPYAANKPGMVGEAIVSLEMNNIGVALTAITDGGDNHFDCNRVDLSDNASSGAQRASAHYVSKPGCTYASNDILIQLIQYDGDPSNPDHSLTHYKVLATFDLAQYDTLFRIPTANWGTPHLSANISMVGNVVIASIADSTNTSTIWSSGPIQMTGLGGTTGNQAIWGVGSHAAYTGGDGTTGFSGSITLIAPATLPSSMLNNGNLDTGVITGWTPYRQTGTQWMVAPVIEDATTISGEYYASTPSTTSGSYALTTGNYDGPLDGSSCGAYETLIVSTAAGSQYTLTGDVAGGVNLESGTTPSPSGLWEVGIIPGGWDETKLDDPSTLKAFTLTKTINVGFDPPNFNWRHFSYTFTPTSNNITVYVRYKGWDASDSWARGHLGAFFDSMWLGGPSSPCNTPWADANGDGTVDMNDFAVLQRCYNGGGGSTTGAVVDGYQCVCFDHLGTSGVVDDADVAQFLVCASGPGVPWASTSQCP